MRRALTEIPEAQLHYRLGDVTLFWPSEDLDAPDAVLDAAMEVVGAIGAFRPE